MNIRNASLDDANSICLIYNYYVENTTITFETKPLSEEEMQQRIKGFLDEGFPYLVAEEDEIIIGYCYLHNWNNRAAYVSTKEITVYVNNNEKGKGIGTILYQALFGYIYKQNIHALIAGICIPNKDSIHLHEKFGFKQASHMKEIGWKFNEWRDVGHWELIIDEQPPKVLILCTGNSCRSQMAHGFLQSFDPRLQVYSAGTQASGKLNSKAVEVMKECGININHHTSDSVEKYLNETWDYVITVCGGANESCPSFHGKVKNRLHIGFDDPSEAKGSPEFIHNEFIRVRDEIKKSFYDFYITNIKSQ